SPRVCPESGNNPSSSSFGPWDDIYLTKRVTCAVYFMSQDSSIGFESKLLIFPYGTGEPQLYMKRAAC
ncbi:unnamed protein product, partial [Larinioides sclopetarius]